MREIRSLPSCLLHVDHFQGGIAKDDFVVHRNATLTLGDCVHDPIHVVNIIGDFHSVALVCPDLLVGLGKDAELCGVEPAILIGVCRVPSLLHLRVARIPELRVERVLHLLDAVPVCRLLLGGAVSHLVVAGLRDLLANSLQVRRHLIPQHVELGHVAAHVDEKVLHCDAVALCHRVNVVEHVLGFRVVEVASVAPGLSLRCVRLENEGLELGQVELTVLVGVRLVVLVGQSGHGLRLELSVFVESFLARPESIQLLSRGIGLDVSVMSGRLGLDLRDEFWSKCWSCLCHIFFVLSD